MMVYRRTNRSWKKWIIAAIIFGLAMTITFADVEGNQKGNSLSPGSNDVNPSPKSDPAGEKAVRPSDAQRTQTSEGPGGLTAIPEPSTLILVGLGLSTAYLVRRRLTRS